MAGVTWLHLSDWHQGSEDQYREAHINRTVVLDKLIEDIRNRANIHADLAEIDFIIFSGDVAFSGKDEQYNAAWRDLFAQLLEVSKLGPDKLFFVPGNHDLDTQTFDLLPRQISSPIYSTEDFKIWLENSIRLQRLLDPFAAYEQFVRRYTKQEQPAYASIRKFEIAGKKIGLLGLNSALMCGRNRVGRGRNKHVDDYGHLLVGEPQFYFRLQNISDADIRIAVMHHTFEWLIEPERTRLKEQLGEQCHFILCGHQHTPEVNVIRGTIGECLIIPAGASYDRRLSEDPLYTNGYNFVHLDFATAQGTVYLRRYSDRRPRWIQDTETYPDGQLIFNLPKNLHQSVLPSGTPATVSRTNQSFTSPTGSTAQDNNQASHISLPAPAVATIDGANASNDKQRKEEDRPLNQAYKYISEALEFVQNAGAPFEGQGYIWERSYTEAPELFERTKASLKAMHESLDKVVALAEASSKYPKLVVNYNDIVNQIYEIESELDSLISFFDEEQPQREQVTKSVSSLVRQLNTLDQSIREENISHSGI